ncbi:hypothetical protein [Streptomyces sparsogenes]|uniref:hypothetical protein n=1 Tax=Streptomyces sparsogenes TaxID=67365 RepID=UPI0033FAD541
MTFPPSPHDPNRPGNGGGFGPPPEQGFGPPPQQGFGPPPEQGFGPPAQPGPPAPQAPLPPSGGFGPPAGALPPGALPPGALPPGALPPPPPPGPGRGGARIAAIAVASVVAGALFIGGIVLGTRDDGGKTEASADTKSSGSPSSSPSASASESAAPSPSGSSDSSGSADPGKGAPLGGGSDVPDGGSTPSASESADPGDLVPYVVLKPGQCFDHPALDSSVTKVEKRGCDGPHDGEVIANETLTGDFATEKAIQDKSLTLCETDAKERLKSIPNDGRMYYYYALYPALGTYRIQGQDQVSCALTLSGSLNGKKLTKPLPG